MIKCHKLSLTEAIIERLEILEHRFDVFLLPIIYEN
jgi:hypothetical protein